MKKTTRYVLEIKYIIIEVFLMFILWVIGNYTIQLYITKKKKNVAVVFIDFYNLF